MKIILRIIADIVLLLSVLLLPWWVLVILGFIFLFYFKLYIEYIVAGFLKDVLFGVAPYAFLPISPWLTIGTGVLLVIAEHVKKGIRY